MVVLQALLKEDVGFLQPASRRNEVMAWVKSSVRDFSISRSAAAMPWGIPLPMDASHNTYVWCVILYRDVSDCNLESTCRSEHLIICEMCIPLPIGP